MTALPGRLLEKMAARIVDAATYERVLRPLVADLQFEHARARSFGERTLIRLRSVLAFWVVLARAATWMAVAGPREDRAATGRVVLRVLTATAVLTGMLAVQCAWQLRNFPLLLPAYPFVLPAMLLVALPVGALLAGLFAGPTTPEHTRAAWRVAVAAGAVTFALGAWVTPLANQAFFQRVVRALSENPYVSVDRGERSAPARVDRGHRAMTLAQLSERAAHVRAWGRGLDELPCLRAEWHKRPSLGVACVAFALLGSGLGAARCRKVWRVLGAVAVVVGFYFAIHEGQRLADAGRLDPVPAMWGPAVALGLGTLALPRAARMPAPVVS